MPAFLSLSYSIISPLRQPLDLTTITEGVVSALHIDSTDELTAQMLQAFNGNRHAQSSGVEWPNVLNSKCTFE